MPDFPLDTRSSFSLFSWIENLLICFWCSDCSGSHALNATCIKASGDNYLKIFFRFDWNSLQIHGKSEQIFWCVLFEFHWHIERSALLSTYESYMLSNNMSLAFSTTLDGNWAWTKILISCIRCCESNHFFCWLFILGNIHGTKSSQKAFELETMVRN